MSSSTNTNPLKRVRVAHACERCRHMKIKCDGKQPACSHCEGYEYECSYSKSEKREKTNTYAQQQALEAAESSLSDLRGCLHQYDGLIEKSIAKLAEPHKLDIERSLHSIRSAAANSASALALDSAPKAQSESRPPSSCLRTDPYHGEASDVQFYNLVKQVFQEPKLSDPSPRSIDNYDQDEVDSQEADSGVPIQLPSNELVEEYLELYFATIHIAYPFIPQQTFLQTYKALRNGSANERVDASWLATFYIIMALGSYYMSFASRRLAEDGLHEVYYHRAQWLSGKDPRNRSLSQVTFFLAKCFYLLATSRIDNCWTTLGIAVRLAQSTGLHAEGEDVSARPLKVETRRRTWYSLYVLDRLLALQLGRPPAIHDEDCYISVPSRIDETNVDWTNDSVQIHTEARPIMIDYFLHVIEFSKIVGQVLRKLYGHGYKEFAVDDLLIAKKLDDQLLLWRSSLPRLLRFDLGHAFENSATFKRQTLKRNMLAMKFHHLRALIYRPCLCIKLSQARHKPSLEVLSANRRSIEKYQHICISEARKTASLLHNIPDKETLIHDFPWWQMISCLICASSTLLIARLPGVQLTANDDMDACSLQSDAATCLEVLEAFSTRSTGARMARDMLQRLQNTGLQGNRMRDIDLSNTLSDNDGSEITCFNNMDALLCPPGDYYPRDVGFANESWPLEVLDFMWPDQISGGSL